MHIFVVYDGIKARDKRAFIMGYFLQVLWLKHIKQEGGVMGSTVDVGTDNVIKLYVVHFKKSETYKKCYVYVLLLKQLKSESTF